MCALAQAAAPCGWLPPSGLSRESRTFTSARQWTVEWSGVSGPGAGGQGWSSEYPGFQCPASYPYSLLTPQTTRRLELLFRGQFEFRFASKTK